MMRSRLFTAGIAAAMLASALMGTTVFAEDAPVKLRMASTVSQAALDSRNSGMAAGLMTWIDTVQEESGGTITVDLFADGMLATGTDAIVNGIQTGAFEVSHFNTGSWASYTDAFAEMNVPYLFSDYDQVNAVLEGEIGDAMTAKLEADVPGIKALGCISIGFRNMTTSKEVHSVEDMKGLKMRTMDDPLQIACMEAMGATCTSVPISDLYSALQTKMVDGQENPLTTIRDNKYYEVNDYCCLTRHSFTSTFVFMNADIYNSLSDNQKAAVEKANEAAWAASCEAAANSDDACKEELEGFGMTVYQPTEEELQGFKDVASTVWPKAEEIMGSDRYNALMAAVG